MAALTSFTQVRSLGASPSSAVLAEREVRHRTPRHSTGVLHGEEQAARARFVDVSESKVWSVQVTLPEVMWYFGWTGDRVRQVDLPEPLGP
jgi:hypothetical protein